MQHFASDHDAGICLKARHALIVANLGGQTLAQIETGESGGFALLIAPGVAGRLMRDAINATDATDAIDAVITRRVDICNIHYPKQKLVTLAMRPSGVASCAGVDMRQRGMSARFSRQNNQGE